MEKKRYTIVNLPREFNPIARAVWLSLEGTIFAIGETLVFTDESENVEEPRGIFQSYEAFEDWLVQCATEWLIDQDDDTMRQALYENLRNPT